MYVNSLGDLSPVQERQLRVAQAAVAEATRNLARTNLIPRARTAWETKLATAQAKIAALINTTMPVTPTPTPTPTPTGWLPPAIWPTVPVSSPPVVTVTQTPATTEMVIDNKWLLIGGGLMALMMLK